MGCLGVGGFALRAAADKAGLTTSPQRDLGRINSWMDDEPLTLHAQWEPPFAS
jgi:hypothetical protein